MNQEKFISSYIELLNNTLTEAIQKNLTILAQKNVIESELNELKNSISSSNEVLKVSLKQKENEINELKTQLNDARKQKEMATVESNELKKNVQHVDTFKNELIKTRNELQKANEELSKKNSEIENLKQQIETLSTPPVTINKLSKKPVKKIAEENTPNKVFNVRDAGNF